MVKIRRRLRQFLLSDFSTHTLVNRHHVSSECFHLQIQVAYAAGITASGITKEVGELLKDIPYVKGVAGTVLQIIKIGDVSDHTSSSCFDRSLIDTHRRSSKTGIVVRSLQRSSENIRLPCFVHWIKFISHRKRTN